MKNQYHHHWTLDKNLTAKIGPPIAHKESVNCQSCPTYSTQIKCCTYEPYIGNFVIGRHLELFINFISEDPLSFWPVGFYPNFKLRKSIEANPSLFGREPNLLCRFFKEGQCRIWVARGVVCLNYYCTHDFGELGRIAWERQEATWLQIENELTQEILARMAYPSKKVALQIDWQYLAALSEKQLIELNEECWRLTGFSSRDDFYLQCQQHYLLIQNE